MSGKSDRRDRAQTDARRRVLEPNDVLGTVEFHFVAGACIRPALTRELDRLRGNDFAHPMMGRCWEVIRKHADEPFVDAWMLADELGKEHLDFFQDVFLHGRVATTNWDYWADQVISRTNRRRAAWQVAECADAIKKATTDEEIEELVNNLRRDIQPLHRGDPPLAGDVMYAVGQEVSQRAEKLAAGEDVTPLTIPTDVAFLDHELPGGLPLYYQVALAGRTSHGKSTVAQILSCVGAQNGYPVHYIGLEDPAKLFAMRLLANVAGVDVRHQVTGDIPPNRVREYSRAAIAKVNPEHDWVNLIAYDDRGGTVDQLVARAERFQQRHGTAMVVCDYIQQVKKSDPRMSQEEHIDQVMTTFQDAAKRNGWCQLSVSQMNRSHAARGRDDQEPKLSDMRGSGSIEERSSAAVLVWRPNVERELHADLPIDDLVLIIAKNKWGPRDMRYTVRVNLPLYRLEPELRPWER